MFWSLLLAAQAAGLPPTAAVCLTAPVPTPTARLSGLTVTPSGVVFAHRAFPVTGNGASVPLPDDEEVEGADAGDQIRFEVLVRNDGPDPTADPTIRVGSHAQLRPPGGVGGYSVSVVDIEGNAVPFSGDPFGAGATINGVLMPGDQLTLAWTAELKGTVSAGEA
ncbi:MAG TPA: hypothetical protein PKA64_22195, partial [Myxococcota bacterium]|nr:hypothetical protein [Myxococcota bacterium]